MAERATADSVGAALDGPNYRAALNIIKTDIARAKQTQSKAGGEAGQAWTRIEKMRVNKKGAQIAASIIAMEEALAHDVIRSLVNIVYYAGMLPTPDLVDIAERLGSGAGLDDEDPEGAKDEDTVQDNDPPGGDAPAEEPPADAAKESKRAAPKPKRMSPAEAKAEAVRHLRSVPTATSPSAAAH